MQETRVWLLGQEDPLRREWLPTLVFLPGESHGQRSLVGYSPKDPKSQTQLSDRACMHYVKWRRPPQGMGKTAHSFTYCIYSDCDYSKFIISWSNSAPMWFVPTYMLLRIIIQNICGRTLAVTVWAFYSSGSLCVTVKFHWVIRWRICGLSSNAWWLGFHMKSTREAFIPWEMALLGAP